MSASRPARLGFLIVIFDVLAVRLALALDPIISCNANCYGEAADDVPLGPGRTVLKGVSLKECGQACGETEGCEGITYTEEHHPPACYGKRNLKTGLCQVGGNFVTEAFKTPPRGTCTILGDPHVLTFDAPFGPTTETFKPGVYRLVESASLTIQGRFGYTRRFASAAALVGIAVQGPMFLNHKFVLEYAGPGQWQDGFQVYWDAAAILQGYPSTFSSPDGILSASKKPLDPNRLRPEAVQKLGHVDGTLPSIELLFSKELYVLVVLGPDNINVIIEMAKIDGQDGFCGNFDCNQGNDSPEDLRSRGLGDPISEIGSLFAQSPPPPPSEQAITSAAPRVEDCAPRLRAQAEIKCQAAGADSLVKMCIYDVCASGRIKVALEEDIVSQVALEEPIPSATVAGYDCKAGQEWTWSHDRRHFCCKFAGKGCMEAPPPSKPIPMSTTNASTPRSTAELNAAVVNVGCPCASAVGDAGPCPCGQSMPTVPCPCHQPNASCPCPHGMQPQQAANLAATSEPSDSKANARDLLFPSLGFSSARRRRSVSLASTLQQDQREATKEDEAEEAEEAATSLGPTSNARAHGRPGRRRSVEGHLTEPADVSMEPADAGIQLSCDLNCFGTAAKPVDLPTAAGAGDTNGMSGLSLEACRDYCFDTRECEGIVFSARKCYGKKDIFTSKCQPGAGSVRTEVLRGMPRGVCAVLGGPHVVTIDNPQGDTVDQYNPGEYYLVMSSGVQITSRIGYGQRFPKETSIIGIAVSGVFLGGHTVAVQFVEGDAKNGTFVAYWDGKEILKNFPSSFTANDNELRADYKMIDPELHHDQARHSIGGEKSSGKRPSYLFRFLPDWQMYILPGEDTMNVVIEMIKQTDGQDGYCGNFNCNPLDDTLVALTGRGRAGRVDPAKSLFKGTPAPSSSQVPDRYSKRFELQDCDPILHSKAEARCHGMPSESLSRACIYDVCVAGSLEAANDELAAADVRVRADVDLEALAEKFWTHMVRLKGDTLPLYLVIGACLISASVCALFGRATRGLALFSASSDSRSPSLSGGLTSVYQPVASVVVEGVSAVVSFCRRRWHEDGSEQYMPVGTIDESSCLAEEKECLLV